MMQLLVFFFFLHFPGICSSSFNYFPSPTAKLCSPGESSALLRFKNTIRIDRKATGLRCSRFVRSFPKTDSWNQSNDCCSWVGVTCNKLTGHVIGLDLSSSWISAAVHVNSSLFQLRHLRRLNLACNNFSRSKILSNFSQLTKLTHLNLNTSYFTGQVPLEISQLSKLVSLDLSFNSIQLDQHSFNKLSRNLTELRDLHLAGVDMYSVVPGSLMNLSSSLISVVLADNQLHGDFPTDFFRFPFLQRIIVKWSSGLRGYLPNSNWSSPLTLLVLIDTGFSGKLPNTIGSLIHLETLDLCCNNFEGSIPISLGNLTSLTFANLFQNSFTGQIPATISGLSQISCLVLGENNFSGLFPDVLGNLSNLVQVFVFGNNFHGQFPTSVFNLTQLSELDFSNNLFEGQFPSQVSGLPVLQYLETLSLRNNFFNGRIPSWLFSLPSLKYLDLGNNKLRGPIDHPVRWTESLVDLHLENNEIDGQVPNFMFEQVNLTELFLSSNNFSGVIKSDMFSKLKSIRYVDFSYNSYLSLANSDMNFSLPLLYIFIFSSCNLTEFPNFLGDSENMRSLDLSDNTIFGKIPQREMKNCSNLKYLNVSYNLLTSLEQIQFMSLEILDLRSNLLQGPLMILAPKMQLALFSNNKLTGEIPSSLCDFSNLEVLDLSNNSLSGKIPECLTMARNNNLTTLSLHGNELEGPLPFSLASCSRLEVFDAGNNKINDTFPYGLAVLPELQVLILRSNKFFGPIDDSKIRFPFPRLRIIDISRNRFTGLLPTIFFNNFEAMMQGNNNSVKVEYMGKAGYYQDSVVLTVKGIDITMKRILTIFTTVDLSSNQFQGQIPEVIGKLNSLIVLNFSLNNLTGDIPLSLWNLTNLESLDLSSNKLAGNIPAQLKELTFLSILNLSYNQLVGLIPQGNQFDTFENNSYIGNLGLCGSPLSEKCSNDDAPEPTPTILDEEDNDSGWFDWKVIMMGYASGLVIGFSIGYIVFSTRKPQWFVRIIERGQLKIVRRLNYGRYK